MSAPRPLPVADEKIGLEILRAFARERSLLTPLRMMHKFVGNVFQITLPGFQPAVFVGSQANRALLVTDREKFLWRVESDPVTRLLRRGLLVTDGAEHDRLRALMDPPLRRGQTASYIPKMWGYTNDVARAWQTGETRNMLIEMRRVALLILMGCLFRVEFAPDMEQLWKPILKLLDYISPGLWILFPNLPRPTYRRAIQTVDEYLYQLIRDRRVELSRDPVASKYSDLLTRLCLGADMSDDLIRDQLLTMLIAGHDTSTALLSWTLFLLGAHPETLTEARAQVNEVMPDPAVPPSIEQLNRLDVLDRIVSESLRLYPPIHIGNRRVIENETVLEYNVPQDTRVMYSIFLSHHDPQYWDNPETFCPARFDNNQPSPPPLTYIPFGGGPRNCIGAAFSQVEALVVLSRLLQTFDFNLVNANKIKPHMGATLEPRPGPLMRLTRFVPSP